MDFFLLEVELSDYFQMKKRRNGTLGFILLDLELSDYFQMKKGEMELWTLLFTRSGTF